MHPRPGTTGPRETELTCENRNNFRCRPRLPSWIEANDLHCPAHPRHVTLPPLSKPFLPTVTVGITFRRRPIVTILRPRWVVPRLEPLKAVMPTLPQSYYP